MSRCNITNIPQSLNTQTWLCESRFANCLSPISNVRSSMNRWERNGQIYILSSTTLPWTIPFTPIPDINPPSLLNQSINHNPLPSITPRPSQTSASSFSFYIPFFLHLPILLCALLTLHTIYRPQKNETLCSRRLTFLRTPRWVEKR